MTTTEAQCLPQDTLVIEPVAWRYRHSEGENWYFGPDAKGWWECQPLYSEATIRSLSEANAALEVVLGGEAKRCALLLSAKNHWMDRAGAAEVALSAATLEIERLKGAGERLVKRANAYDKPDVDFSGSFPNDDREWVQVPLGELRTLRTTLAASKAEAAERGNDLEGGDDERA